MDEILISLYCPSTSRSYDFWMPKRMQVQSVIEQLCDAICEYEKSSNIFKDRDKLVLCSYMNGRTLSLNLTMEDEQVKTGDRLALV